MPPRGRFRALLPIAVVLVATACARRERTRPESDSARVVDDHRIGAGAYSIVAVAADLPPRSDLLASDFRLARRFAGRVDTVNCCVGLWIGDQVVDLDRIVGTKVHTYEKSLLAEFLFVVDSGTTEVSLIYKGTGTGPWLPIARRRQPN